MTATIQPMILWSLELSGYALAITDLFDLGDKIERCCERTRFHLVRLLKGLGAKGFLFILLASSLAAKFFVSDIYAGPRDALIQLYSGENITAWLAIQGVFWTLLIIWSGLFLVLTYCFLLMLFVLFVLRALATHPRGSAGGVGLLLTILPRVLAFTGISAN